MSSCCQNVHFFKSFYSSQRRIVPKEEIRIIVDKRFDKDDSEVEERLNDESKDVQTIQRESPNFNDDDEVANPQATSRRSSGNFTATVRKTVIWDNLQNREATHSEGDPYDFVPSQVTAIKSKKKIRKLKETKLKIDSKRVKVPKTNEQIVKQNQFYEDILGSLIDASPIPKSVENGEVLKPKLTVRLKFPKKSPFAGLSPRPPGISPEIIHHNEKMQLPKGEWKRPKRKADLFSDWSSSQVEKMDDLNKELLNIDNVELNVVKEKNSVNQRIKDLSADNNYAASSKRRKVDLRSLEENVPEPVIVRYPNESSVATMQEFAVVSFNPGSDPVPIVNNPGPPGDLECIQLSSSGCSGTTVNSPIVPDKKIIRVLSSDSQLETDGENKSNLEDNTCRSVVEEINSQHETSIEFSQKEAPLGTIEEFNPIADDFSPITTQAAVDKEYIQGSSTNSPHKMDGENINSEDEQNICPTNPLLDKVFCSQSTQISDKEYVHILAPDTEEAVKVCELTANTNACIADTEIVGDLSAVCTKNNKSTFF